MVEIEAGCEGRPALAVLEPGDSTLVKRLFGRLSAASIYRRFFSPITRPDLFERSVQAVDHRDREAIGAVAGGELVGVAQYSRKPMDSQGGQAELAIVVDDAWQRQGLGTRMIAALADRATAAGIDSFAVDIQGDNYGALRLFNRIAPRARLTYSGGVGEGVIPLRG